MSSVRIGLRPAQDKTGDGFKTFPSLGEDGITADELAIPLVHRGSKTPHGLLIQ